MPGPSPTRVRHSPAAAAPAPERDSLALYVPLGLLSAAALALEVLLTKFLAYSVSAILVSIVLGIALLGFGAGGTLAAIRPGWASSEGLFGRLAWASLGFSASTLFAFAIFVRVSSHVKDLGLTTVLVAALLTLPFLFAGLVVALSLTVASTGRAYAANLLGSAVGCLVPFVLLRPLGGERTVPVLALVGVASAWLFASRARGEAGVQRAVLGAIAASSAAIALGPWLYAPAPEPAPFGQLQVVRDYVLARGGEERLLYDRWNAVGRIQIFGYESVAGQPSPYPFLFYVQDSSAGSSLARWDGEGNPSAGAAVPLPEEDVVGRACEESLWGQAYFAPRRRVLVIGLGGGMDVQCALFHGAESVDVVEINPDSIASVRGRFDQWTGHLGENPRVHYHLGDGRSFVHRMEGARYDVIQLSGVDTKNAASSGGLALSENTLYTREAFDDYLENLDDGGVLSIVRFSDAEAVRLARTAVEALRRRGEHHPEAHVVVRDSTYVRGLVVRKKPFPPGEVAAVEEALAPKVPGAPYGVSIFFYEAMDMDFRIPPVLEYVPGHVGAGTAATYLDAVRSGTEARFFAEYPFDVSPATDDRPFFFDVFRYRGADALAYPHVRMLSAVLASILVLAVALVLLPVRRARGALEGASWLGAAFFASIGLAYLFVEVWLIHRLGVYLGHQTYALGVVLFTLLLGTGLGAGLGERLRGKVRPAGAVSVGLVVTALALAHFAAPALLEATKVAPLSARLTLASLGVVFLGVLMGQPFPAGLGWARERDPGAIPWYVGINGFASVVATLVVIPLSHAGGYEVVLAAGAVLYGVAALAAMAFRALPAR